jgi:hypothetical protein
LAGLFKEQQDYMQDIVDIALQYQAQLKQLQACCGLSGVQNRSGHRLCMRTLTKALPSAKAGSILDLQPMTLSS